MVPESHPLVNRLVCCTADGSNCNECSSKRLAESARELAKEQEPWAAGRSTVEEKEDRQKAKEGREIGIVLQHELTLALTNLDGTNALRLLTCVAGLDGTASEVMGKICDELRLKPQEQRAALAGLFSVVERRLPQIVCVLFIEALLPLLQQRALLHFRHKRHESGDDALDLSQEMVANILNALIGKWPRGNVGAWVSAIRENLYVDHVRKRARGRKVLDNIEESWRATRR